MKKIENIIEQLQATILGKIGSYGESIDDIKNEMGMMQESFSKALGPLIDRSREKSEKPAKRKPARKSDGFEHYLR